MTSPEQITRLFPEMMQPNVRPIIEKLYHEHSLEVWTPMLVIQAATGRSMVKAASKAATLHRPWWLGIQFAALILIAFLGSFILGFQIGIYREIRITVERLDRKTPVFPAYNLENGNRRYRFVPEVTQ